MQKTPLALLTAILAAGAVTSTAYAAGFEKGVMWSGKYSGISNAATSSAHGAEALYFNPAGITTGNGTFEFSGNFSPTLDKFSGQARDATTAAGTGAIEINTPTHFSPSFGGFAGYNITPQWGIAIGSYVSAGSKAEFPSLSPFTDIANPFKTDIYSVEFALGTGYEVLPGLRIGAAYRIVMTHAAFATSTFLPNATLASGALGATAAGAATGLGATGVENTDIESLSNTRYNGFKLGVQYTSTNKVWGVGATYRSRIEGALHGTANSEVELQSGGNVLPGATNTASTASVYTALPEQVSAGANVAIVPTLRGFLQYDWTRYHVDRLLDTGVTLPTGGIATPLGLNWNNENQLRFALECTAVEDWAFRAGYSWISQVTPNDAALPNLIAPAHGNTITLGAGTQVLNHTLDLDAALEYSWASGTATGEAGGSAALPNWATDGSYSSKAYALHLGVTYRI